MAPNETFLTEQALVDLTTLQQPPCLSLYQPTHRRRPENRQDPIRFRNLVKDLGASLRQTYSDAETRQLLEQFERLSEDQDFWEHTQDGLAVMSGPALFRVFRLQQPVPELAVVADTFHTKPLRRYLQEMGRYQVLGLTRDTMSLFEGSRDSLDRIEPEAGVPRTIVEALGSELTEPHQTVASYGGTGQGSSPMHHTNGTKQDEIDSDTERFFRAVDRAVLTHHSRPTGQPLILAALPQHHHLFQQVSHNPFLLPEGLRMHPDTLTVDELRERAWQAVAPLYSQRFAELADEFGRAKAEGLGSDDMADVARAAIAGRIATLSIESNRHIAGQLEPSTGEVNFGALGHPAVDDLLDDLAEFVVKLGGQVFVIPADEMPTRSGIAAIYRY